MVRQQRIVRGTALVERERFQSEPAAATDNISLGPNRERQTTKPVFDGDLSNRQGTEKHFVPGVAAARQSRLRQLRVVRRQPKKGAGIEE